MLVEGVRVAAEERGSGLGSALLTWVEGWARAQGAGLVQLTSSSERTAARAFYERLGYVASHVGMKLDIVVGTAADVVHYDPETFDAPDDQVTSLFEGR